MGIRVIDIFIHNLVLGTFALGRKFRELQNGYLNVYVIYITLGILVILFLILNSKTGFAR